jgi:hypothetical protein
MPFILKLPGLFRTAASALLVASEVAGELAPLAGPGLEKAAALTAVVGLFRALVRRFK